MLAVQTRGVNVWSGRFVAGRSALPAVSRLCPLCPEAAQNCRYGASAGVREQPVIGRSGKTLRTTIVSFSLSCRLLDEKRANSLY